jgi:hypothetical protein
MVVPMRCGIGNTTALDEGSIGMEWGVWSWLYQAVMAWACLEERQPPHSHHQQPLAPQNSQLLYDGRIQVKNKQRCAVIYCVECAHVWDGQVLNLARSCKDRLFMECC